MDVLLLRLYLDLLHVESPQEERLLKLHLFVCSFSSSIKMSKLQRHSREVLEGWDVPIMPWGCKECMSIT